MYVLYCMDSIYIHLAPSWKGEIPLTFWTRSATPPPPPRSFPWFLPPPPIAPPFRPHAVALPGSGSWHKGGVLRATRPTCPPPLPLLKMVSDRALRAQKHPQPAGRRPARDTLGPCLLDCFMELGKGGAGVAPSRAWPPTRFPPGRWCPLKPVASFTDSLRGPFPPRPARMGGGGQRSGLRHRALPACRCTEEENQLRLMTAGTSPGS